MPGCRGRERLSSSAAGSDLCTPACRQEQPQARPAAHPQEASMRTAGPPALQEQPVLVPSYSSPDGSFSAREAKTRAC